MKMLTARDIMTPDVLNVPAHWSVHRLAEFFAENSISGAPVVSEKGDLIGVVTSTDIIKNDTLSEAELENSGPHDYYLRRLENRYAKVEIEALKIGNEPLTTIGDIMTPTVFAVSEDTLLQNIAAKMIRHRIHRIFVTRDEKVVGIISSFDMLKIIRDFGG